MVFISGEQREASRAFDAFIEHTEETLRNPAVAAELGAIATEILQITDTAFLPNIRSGTFLVPEQQRGSANLAFMPLTEEQADNAYAITTSFAEEPGIRFWSADEAAVSERYGLELPGELEAIFRKGPEGGLKGNTNSVGLKGLRPSVLARTQATIGLTPSGEYWAARPRLMIRSSLLQKNPPEACGAMVAHEAIHASDALEDGPLYGAYTYGGASELRAYYVGAVVARLTGAVSADGQNPAQVEKLRLQELAHMNGPFTPNATLMRVMADMNVI